MTENLPAIRADLSARIKYQCGTGPAPSAIPPHEPQGGSERSSLANSSPAAGHADILRRQSRKWWRLEQKAARRRDYLAAHEYATLADKYWDKAKAAEQGNSKDEPRP